MSYDFNQRSEAVALLQSIAQSPTAYHAVANIRRELIQNGFVCLDESETWELRAGGRYLVTRNDSSCIAFCLPSRTERAASYRVIAAHTDSPAFKLKDIFERPTENYCRANVEKYGGMLCSSWMDRPLSVAGRVMLRTEQGVACRLIDFDRSCAIIPNLAIHMDRSANDGKSYNAQLDMLPIFGLRAEGQTGSFSEQLLAELGTDAEHLLAHDLFLYCREPGYLWGAREEMISAPRLDDLECVFGALRAFLKTDAEQADHICVFAAFDNEEVGSSTLQGAASSFLEDTIDRIEGSHFGQQDTEGRHTRLARSLMLSADNAHAVHPNHPEFADAQNRPVIGGGVVVKFNAQQRYATDAVGASILRCICARAEVKTQSYANRSDLAGGSTLGSIAGTRVPIRTIDVGLPQLAMHSAFETAGCEDYAAYIRTCHAFYAASVRQQDDQYCVSL